MMPGLDGIEVCQRLRRQPDQAGLPILLLTALDRPEDKTPGPRGGRERLPVEAASTRASSRPGFARYLRTKALQDRLADLLGRYVSESVAAEALRDPFGVSLGGDRRYVSTLFADVRGYTAMAAEHPAEATLELLNRYLTVVSDAVERHGGTVADLLGDGVFAFFGAPIMHSNDPERAVRAALAIQTAVQRMDIPTMPGVRLQAGIGITSGEVIAGNVGSERRMHYAVVGDSVNVASRLQMAAGPGQILVDEPTRDAVRDVFVMQDLGNLRLSGKSDWVRAFNVIALGRTAVEGPSEPDQPTHASTMRHPDEG